MRNLARFAENGGSFGALVCPLLGLPRRTDFHLSPVSGERGMRIGRWLLWLLITFITGGLLCACATKEASDEAPTVTVQVGAAENEPIKLEIAADAVLYAKDQAALIPKIAAPVSKFYVDRGSPVRAGEVLAELENKDLASVVADNQGAYAQAQAAYQSAAEKAPRDLSLSKDQLDAAQKVYDNRKFLLDQGAVSAKDVQDAQIALTQARTQYEAAQKQYDLKGAEGQLNSAKAKTAGAEAQLNYTKIISPINGVVTDRPFYPGEMAPAGSPILTVMDLSQVIARAHIPQQLAAQLKAGDAAEISNPGTKAVGGKVTLVSPALDPNSTTVEVWVQAPNPGGQFKPGSTVHVSMVAQTVPHAVVIPAEALITSADGVTSVIALDSNNTPHKQKVKTGIRNGNEVQVTEGLKGGERVVTVGAFELASEDDPVLAKTKIQVQAPKMPDEDEDEEQ
jgi:HlyD family secretion protein